MLELASQALSTSNIILSLLLISLRTKLLIIHNTEIHDKNSKDILFGREGRHGCREERGLVTGVIKPFF